MGQAGTALHAGGQLDQAGGDHHHHLQGQAGDGDRGAQGGDVIIHSYENYFS